MPMSANTKKHINPSIPHWQNLCYDDLPNEVWKEIPGLDAYFLISNFGRVKSLDRTIQCSNGTTRFFKGRVYKASSIKYKNKTIGDYTVEAKVGTFYLGVYHSFRLARTVYNVFVQQLDYSKEQLIVAHKDGNRLNNSVSNLYLQTIAQKQKLILETDRAVKLSTRQTKEGYKKIAAARQKPVTQFNMQGYPVNSFQSIKEASEKTGIDGSNIVCAIKQKKMVSAGGFLWQYGIITQKIDTSYYTDFKAHSNQKKAIPIVQRDIDFKLLNTFNSITEASEKTGIRLSCIVAGLKSKFLIKGYFWQYK